MYNLLYNHNPERKVKAPGPGPEAARAVQKEDHSNGTVCHVLDDPSKTAVISQRGMGQAIGFSKRGSRLGVFVNSKAMEKYIGRDLREKIENPLIFQQRTAAAGSPLATAHGYDATILIDLCNAIIAARNDGKLRGPRYDRMIEQAQH